jgi:hypothetical protein
MGTVNSLHTISIPAGADLSALQYTLVKMGTGFTVVAATAATDNIIGVLMNKPVSGDPAEIAIGGVAKLKSGGVWAAGNTITATTGGVGIVSATDAHRVVGFALEVAAANDLAKVLVMPHQKASA